MSDLQDLYQELILDHNKHPRNRGRMDAADRSAEGYNPLCGDRLTVYLRVKDNIVEDIAFEGSGCAISTASASLMSESVKGKTLDEAKALFGRFHEMVAGGHREIGDDPTMGKLAVFSGVGDYPARVKCATLAWHTVKAAIEDTSEPVSTE